MTANATLEAILEDCKQDITLYSVAADYLEEQGELVIARGLREMLGRAYKVGQLNYLHPHIWYWYDAGEPCSAYGGSRNHHLEHELFCKLNRHHGGSSECGPGDVRFDSFMGATLALACILGEEVMCSEAAEANSRR